MNKVFIDIGAFDGQETYWALQHGYDVYAYEPNLSYAPFLMQYMSAAHVTLAAAWDCDGWAPFYDSRDVFNIGASLYQEKEHAQSEPRIVRTVNIGRDLNQLGRPIDIIKINAEGAEWRILSSIAAHFRDHPHRLGRIFVEDHIGKIKSVTWEQEREAALSLWGTKLEPWLEMVTLEGLR